MKLILILLLFFLGRAQANAQSPKQIQAALIINNVTVKSPVYIKYISPTDIESVNIQKRSKNFPNGAINITMKYNAHWLNLLHSKFLSIKAITKVILPNLNTQTPINYALNGQLLKDTTGMLIPEICVISVKVVKASEEPFYKIALPNAVLVLINTNPKWTPPNSSMVYIRGLSTNTVIDKNPDSCF